MSMDSVLWNILLLLFLGSAISAKSEVVYQAAIMNCTLLNEVWESDVTQGLASLVNYTSNMNSKNLDYTGLCENRKILKTLLERLMQDTRNFSLLDIGILFNNTINFNEPIVCNNISTNFLNVALTINNSHLSNDLLHSKADPFQQDGFGNTALHLAVLNKNMPIIRAILQNNSEGINKKNNNGETPLFISAYQNDTEIFEYLLASGAEVYSYNNVWTTPLHLAAEFGNNDIVRAILRKSVVGVNAQSENGLTALFIATLQNNIETCKLILDSGAFPYIPDDSGTTPLHEAIRRGYLEIAESILKTNKYGANYQDRQGSTALFESAKRNATKIANLLIESGTYLFIVNNFERTALHEAAARGHSEIVHLIVNKNKIGIDWRDNENATALYLAVKNNSAESCEVLLNAGADPKIADNLGNTPLHVAAENGHLKAAQVILKSNINLINITNNDGNTSLILASNCNRQDIVRFLLMNSAGVNIVNNYGWSSLFTCVYREYSGVAEVLLTKKESINFQNGEGITALHIASAYNKSEEIQILIQNGALSLPDNDGWIPLHYSAANNHLELIDTFLSLNATSIDVQNFKGNTALHLSATYEKVEAVMRLLKKGANPCIINYLGEIPLHVAVDVGNPIIILDIINSSPSSVFDAVDGYGRTPLLRASHASVKTFQFLLEKGANPFKSTPTHGSALHYAAEKGNLGITELLLRWFPKLLDHLHGGMTPLHQAVLYCERNKLVNYLLQKRAKTVISTVFGNNVLHFASRYCGYDTFRLIFSKSEEELENMSRSTMAFINQQDYIGTTPLFEAALAGNEEIFQFLWSRGGHVVLTDSYSCSLLVYASKGGKIKIIEHILKETNISVNKNCYDGLTPLMAAAYSGNVEAFEFLVDKGAKLGSITEDGNTVLHYAAAGKGCPLIISTIISKTEININMRNLEGFTPIMYAVKSGNFDAFKFLVENTNADLLQVNNYGDNSITLAAREGNRAMLQSLNVSSYDVDVLLGITLARSELPTDELLTNFLSKSSIAKEPQTYAIAKGELQTLEGILPQGYHLRPSRFPVIIKEFVKDYNRVMTGRDEDGLLLTNESSLTPLDISLLFFKNMKVVKNLLLITQANCSTLNFRKMMFNTFDFAILAQLKNNLNDCTVYSMFHISKSCLSQITNKYGWTLVHKTAWIGNRFFLHFLESQGIDFDRPDVFGRTPLHIAALKGDYVIVNRILYVSDNSINSTDVHGYTPLHLSQIYLYRKPPYTLPNLSLTTGPQVSFKTNPPSKFLGFDESSNSHIGIIWTLAYHHANLNSQDKQGWTPLHWAAAAGDIMSVTLLVSLGAIVNTPSYTNQTPMEVARMWGRKVVYNYLKQHGAVW